jgi:hypothetical protein
LQSYVLSHPSRIWTPPSLTRRGRQPTPPSSPSETLIRDCKASQNQLTTLLAQVHLLLKGYGEKAEDAASRDAGFQWLLGRFTIEQVRDAFRVYVERRSDLPAPADIIQIIEPPPEPLSAALYVSYQKKAYSGGFLLSSERAFCRAFEAQEEGKTRGGSDTLRECQRELASFKELDGIGYSGSDYD